MKRVLYFLIGLTVPTAAFAQASEPPVPVRTVAPEYPSEMRRTAASGLVMVNCLVDEKGNVTDPKIEKSTAEAFEKPAIEALKKWKFKPAKQDGAPVAVRVCIPIKFVFEG
jgi:periplasmic protein TonB